MAKDDSLVCERAFHVRESKRKEVFYIYDAHYADRAALHIECTIYYQRREFIAHKLASRASRSGSCLFEKFK